MLSGRFLTKVSLNTSFNGVRFMGKRKSVLDQFIEALFELTGYFWQVGAVVTVILSFLTYKSAVWAFEANTLTNTDNQVTAALLNNIGWVYYLFPLTFLIFTILFGAKSISVYLRNNRI